MTAHFREKPKLKPLIFLIQFCRSCINKWDLQKTRVRARLQKAVSNSEPVDQFHRA